MTIAAPQTRSASIPLHVRDYVRRTFAPRHRRVLRAFAEALFFDPTTPFEPGQLDALVEDCDDFVSRASKTLRFGLVTLLDAIRWLPFVILRRLSTFETLSTSDRVEMLSRMDRGRTPLPLLLVAYKTILAMLFFENPEELARTGYPGSERSRWKRALPIASARTRQETRREEEP